MKKIILSVRLFIRSTVSLPVVMRVIWKLIVSVFVCFRVKRQKTFL